MEVWLSQVSIPFLNPNPVKLGSYWHPKPLVGYPLFSWITKAAKLMSLAWFANPVNLSKSTSIKKTISQFINLCLFYYFCISLIQYFKKKLRQRHFYQIQVVERLITSHPIFSMVDYNFHRSDMSKLVQQKIRFNYNTGSIRAKENVKTQI